MLGKEKGKGREGLRGEGWQLEREKVNKGTASVGEILAGALKDNKHVVLYGEPTFGKGKIQSVFQLFDGPGLAVTVARYETPTHTGIDKVRRDFLCQHLSPPFLV
ncbi:carboxyl-terminal-processing peptidase 2 [Populus alba x Populus x berolinensis]|uniref:Carboxyl-terminal-processing peptidase 2 n=1 Tax=Populus alba x Populus x berolinensis TaxID=444605 RepID=A0AAD6RJ45_9ROSI|nr:carboxyl-terminal-processing peptidase 2 [Populus alba x Populus x berolinensis]